MSRTMMIPANDQRWKSAAASKKDPIEVLDNVRILLNNAEHAGVSYDGEKDSAFKMADVDRMESNAREAIEHLSSIEAGLSALISKDDLGSLNHAIVFLERALQQIPTLRKEKGRKDRGRAFASEVSPAKRHVEALARAVSNGPAAQGAALSDALDGIFDRFGSPHSKYERAIERLDSLMAVETVPRKVAAYLALKEAMVKAIDANQAVLVLTQDVQKLLPKSKRR